MAGSDKERINKDFATLVNDMLAALASGMGGRAALTDATEGSVVRTLVEAFGRELAVAYQQAEHVYRMGYLDLAEGVALDNVVALLGLRRRQPGHSKGVVVFSRATPAQKSITIPAGTLVTGKAAPLCETVSEKTMEKGDVEVRVEVRSLEPDSGQVEPGGLNLMPKPILGVERVDNPEFLRPTANPETDEELRQRAFSFYGRAATGTPASLEQAIRAMGLEKVKLVENPLNIPGEIHLMVGDGEVNDTLLEQARSVVDEVRPAGIRLVVMKVKRVMVAIRAGLQLNEDYPPKEMGELTQAIQQELEATFDNLEVAETVRWAKIRNILTSDARVVDIAKAAIEGTNGAQFYPFMQLVAWDAQTNRWEAAPDIEISARMMGNDDLLIQPGERAGLALVDLTPSPPEPLVYVDLICQMGQTPPAGWDAPVKQKLQAILDEIPAARQFHFSDLVKDLELPDKVEAVRVLIIHLLDGRVVQLSNDEIGDFLLPQEKPMARNLSKA